MVGLSCRSSSSCPSPARLSSKSIAVQNELLKSVFSMSPVLSSSHLVPLEKTIPDEASICWDSEKALGSSSMNSGSSYGTPTAKSSAELKKEIAILEVEIMYLENHLLSLYRTAFEERLPTLSNITRTQTVSSSPIVVNQSCHRTAFEERLPSLSNITRSQTVSSSPIVVNQSCQIFEPHKQKGGFLFHDQTSPASLKTKSARGQKIVGSGHRSLAEHLGAFQLDGTLNTPDRLSEDMVRCISSIYCKLADPSQTRAGLLASPASSLSSSSIFSSQNPCDSWSPYCNEDATTNHKLQGLKEENIGRYAAKVEVLKICLDNDNFNYAATMLQNFRSMVGSLEKVDPSKMKREQKLAFWINIHNALVMHAYLAYGTQNRVKSASILKAAYNVGGQCIDAYVIQSSILGIQSHNSAPWLQTLFSPGRKSKTGSTKHVYALEYPEPLVHFALCSGGYYDPVVRVYTAKSIFQDLKYAREEFVQANVYIHKGSKILVPRILDYYTKDMSLSISELLELVNGCFSEVQQNAIRKCMKGRLDKCIHWLPQNSSFRYVIHGELATGIETV